MARPGITYHEVATVAEQLAAEGKNPTIEGIRALTGTGSSSTLAQHLKQWKHNQDATKLQCEKENLPDEMIALMKGLWTRVINQAEEKVIVIQQGFEQTLEKLQHNHNTLQAENAREQQHSQELIKEKDNLIHDKSALEQFIRQLEDEKIASTISFDALTQQLQNKDTRIEELHRLNQQVQANLEHYRESSREQRLLDQQRHEQVQTQLEQTVQQLKQELTLVTQQKNTFQTEGEQLRYANNLLQTQQDQLAAQLETLRNQLRQAEKEVMQHAYAEQNWQSQYQQLQQKTDEQSRVVMNLQTQIAIATQNLSDVQDTLKEVVEQNKTLTHQNWKLAQEKSQLEEEVVV